MKITDELIICWECGQVYRFCDDSHDTIRGDGRKRYDYHDMMFCPICHQARIFELSLREIERMRIDSRDEARHQAQCRNDWEDKAGYFRDELKRKEETIRTLQRQLDDARQLDLPGGGSICKYCHRPLTPVNRFQGGRVADYCSNSCKQKAYRERKRKLQV